MVVFAFLFSIAALGLWILTAIGKCPQWVPGILISLAVCVLTLDAALHYLKS